MTYSIELHVYIDNNNTILPLELYISFYCNRIYFIIQLDIINFFFSSNLYTNIYKYI